MRSLRIFGPVVQFLPALPSVIAPTIHHPLILQLTVLALLVLLLVAAVCGAIGKAIAGGTRGGFLVSLVVGFIGALLGTWLSRQMRLPEIFVVSIDGHPFPVVWSIIGAALFVEDLSKKLKRESPRQAVGHPSLLSGTQSQRNKRLDPAAGKA
jgi:uncharacterized membrane protein YeaQ/YmgE (transglycosylase-associated protein family)